MTQQEKAKLFKELHVKGTPVILFNSWDAGSTKTIANQGAKAMALGSHGVANANGYEDGQNISLELVLENAKRSAEATELPLSLDFETGYGDTTEEIKQSVSKALETGIVGVNIEDQISGGESLYEISEQVERLKAVREAADSHGLELFINARTDLFKNADPATHNQELLDKALERAEAYAAAGADGFFAPGLRDIELIKKLTDASPLPVNIIWLDGMVTPAEIATAGASRISYGPGPYLKMIAWVEEQAKTALNN